MIRLSLCVGIYKLTNLFQNKQDHDLFAVVNLEVASFSYKYLLIMSVDQSGRKDKSFRLD